MMRYLFFSLIALFVMQDAVAQKTVRRDAIKANDFGVSYTLPKTAIEITIDYSKVTKKAGEFYMYAERYLNISNPVTEDIVEYKLDKINATTIGVPDRSNSFLVEFRPNSAAAFITLTEDGLLCAINDNYQFTEKPTEEKREIVGAANLNAHQYFTEEILRAGSSAKQAELVAKQIYRLRESKTDILTGEADNMPPDGNAYKLVMEQLDGQEKALMSLFIGTEVVEPMQKKIVVDIDDKDIDNLVAARFSNRLGVVATNNMAGEPIYLSLNAKNKKTEELLTEKEIADREKKFAKGIVYNIPAKANLKLEFRNKQAVNKECDVVQFGTQDVLDQKPFGDKTNPLKVIFFPDLGAIKQTGTVGR